MHEVQSPQFQTWFAGGGSRLCVCVNRGLGGFELLVWVCRFISPKALQFVGHRRSQV